MRFRHLLAFLAFAAPLAAETGIALSWPDAPRFAELAAIRVPTLVLRGGDRRHLAVDASRRSSRMRSL